MIIPNRNVFKAARAFAEHEPDNIIKDYLFRCPDLDKSDVTKIFQTAKNYSDDVDGGYSAFLNAVNLALHTKAYHMEITSIRNIKNHGFNNGVSSPV